MNKFNSRNSNIFKKGFKERSSASVLIGGADKKEIASKREIIDELIEKAKEKAQKEAQEIINKAKFEANDIISKAQNGAHIIEDKAHKEGFQKGEEEGNNKVNQELQFVLLEGSRILQSIEQERRESLEDEEKRIYQIIIQIAHKLFQRDFQLNPEISIEFIKSAINKLKQKSIVNILINPVIANKLNGLKIDLLSANPGLENLSITAEDSLQLGDLILESNKEKLDFRLATQLEELAKEIIK